MKIAIATDDFTTVTGHIGRCNGFIIYEIEDGKISSRTQIENIFTNHKIGEHHRHGEHDHNHSQGHSGLAEGLVGCSTLICTAAGWRVVEDLKNNGINVIFTNDDNADSAALKFASNTLEINENGVCNSH